MIRLINISLLCIILIGCVSQIAPFKDSMSFWKGREISEYIKVSQSPHANESQYVGARRISKLDNGNKVYEFPYPKCPVFFEVDSKGIIVDITTEGNKDCY